jgi:hypothetical protein
MSAQASEKIQEAFTMNIVHAWTFVFEDERWGMKVVLGALLHLVPFMAPGYLVGVARNVLHDQEQPLPDAGDFLQLLRDGVLASLALFVYFLPLSLFIIAFGQEGGPFEDWGQAGVVCNCAFLTSSRTFFIPLVVWLLVVLPYTVVVGLLLIWGIIGYADSGNPARLFQFWTLFKNPKSYLGGVLVTGLIGLLIGLLTMVLGTVAIITCIGPLVIVFFNNVAMGHLIGQTGRKILPQAQY